MNKISKACKKLYKVIKEEYPNSPSINDTEWSNTSHDLDLFNRFMERWDLTR